MTADPLTAAWDALAPQAGLATKPRPRIVSDRGARRVRRITARVEGPAGPLALRISPGMEAERWRRLADGQTRMHAALADRPLDHAPRIVAADEGTRAILAEWRPGETLLDALLASRSDARTLALMEGAARWTGALHGALAAPAEPLRAGGPVSWLRRLRRKAAPPDAEHLDRALDMLAAEAATLDGALAPRAGHHGDLHAANLIMDGDHACGIDPELPEEAPTARDLAHLLTDVAVRLAPRMPGGRLLPDAMMARVLAAYGRDPGPLLFFARARLIRFWLDVPEDPGARTLRREHVWQGIRARRAGLFAGPAPGERRHPAT